MASQGTVSGAADQTVLGRTFRLSDPQPGVDATRRKIVVLAREPLSDNAVVGDPTVAGAAIEIAVDGGTPGMQTFALPAAGWARRPTDVARPLIGYRYSDPSPGALGPVRSATITVSSTGVFQVKLLIVGGNGPGPQPHVTVLPPDPGTAATVVVSFPNGDRYCTGFGGLAGGKLVNTPGTPPQNTQFKVLSTSLEPVTEVPCPAVGNTTTSTTTAPTTTSTATTATTTSTTRTTVASTTTTTSTTTTVTLPTATTSTTTTTVTTTTAPPTTATTSSSTATTASSTTTTATTTTTSTSAPAPCPARLVFTATAGSPQCGGAPFSPFVPPPEPLFSGAVYDETLGLDKIADLGLGCVNGGGGNAMQIPPTRVPDGFTTIFDVASCAGDVLTLQASATGNPSTCTQGALPTRHCATAPTVPCITAADCASGRGCIADARCYLGPPSPLPAQGTEACIMRAVAADASGTLDRTTGAAAVTIPLVSHVYLTANAASSCPRCVGGVCNAGQRAGLSCTPVGSMQTTHDCPPPDAQWFAAYATTPTFQTGNVTVSSSTGVLCAPNPPVGGIGQLTAGAFGLPTTRRIEQAGLAAGDLRDLMPHEVRLVAGVCVPASGNGITDGKANFPGPAAASVAGTFRLE